MTTTTGTAAGRRMSYQLETLWDYDYAPTHQELESLYETAKKLFTEVLIPRLQRLHLISDRVAPGYRAIGLLPAEGAVAEAAGAAG